MLKAVKDAIPISTDVYDDDIYSLILAAQAELDMLGISTDPADPLIKRAIITYCKCNFGNPANYDRLKASYDEQKAQLMSAHGRGGDGGA